MTCGGSAHVVQMLRTDGAKHWHMVNIGAWSVLSILVSKIHKHIKGSKKGFLRERREEKGCVKIGKSPLF